jgi:hypothetical protein
MSIVKNVKPITGDINDIIRLLKEDKQYHERLLEDSILKLNIDLDGYDIDDFRDKFTEFMLSFGIELAQLDYKYTSNTSKDNSHHVVIPKYYGKATTLKVIMEAFKKKYDLDKPIDVGHLGAGSSGKWFRLPNQTKEGKKGTEHFIKNGKLSQFVLHYINKDESTNLDELPAIQQLLESLQEKPKKVKDTTNPTSPTHHEEPNLDLSEEINQYLNILSVKLRLDDYNEWVKVGALIYSLGLSVSVWDELSKKSNKYEYGATEQKWKTFKRKQYTKATLYYWCKLDNPTKYEQLRQSYYIANQTSIKDNTPIIETIQFDKRYLIENEQDTYMLDHFKTFFESESIKSLNIKSPYGTGKTQLLKRIITDYDPKRVLWLSYRITLTNDILFNFTDLGFQSYQDGDYMADRLIIQLESLSKLENNNDLFIDELESIVPSYDLVVIDEIESILNHFNSETFNGKSRIIFEYLENIIKASNKVISLDGDLNNRSYQFLQTLGDGIYLENICKINDKTLHLTEKELNFQKDILNQLDNNNKIVICSMSSADASKYDTMLNDKYPKKKIYLYTGKSDDCLKKHHLSNVSEHWSQADVIIYSPTIEAGVNFDVPGHFNKIYGILSCQSTSQRAFFQMLSRVRKVSNNQITILNNITYSDNKDFWTFDEVKAGLIATRDNILQYKYVQRGDKIIKTLGLDNYDNNSIYNRVEDLNKHQAYFIS